MTRLATDSRRLSSASLNAARWEKARRADLIIIVVLGSGINAARWEKARRRADLIIIVVPLEWNQHTHAL